MTRTRALVDLDALGDLFPHRVARATDLLTLGLSSRSIQTSCLPGGRWQRVAPGIILLGSDPPTRQQRVAAALKHAGPGAIVTGWDALRQHGMATPAGTADVHLLVPHTRQVRSLPQILVERTATLPKPVLCQGFPFAPLPRAALDTARRLRSPEVTRTLLSEVIQRGRVSPARLREELDTGSGRGRGSALPRSILDEIAHGIRSMAEGWARRLVVRAGLPQPRWNCPIRAPDGDLLGIIDAWWDDVGLAWELNSYQFQLPRAATLDTYRRTSRLTAAGILVIHTPPTRLRDEPTTVMEELRSVHQHATLRPRPPVLCEVAGAS